MLSTSPKKGFVTTILLVIVLLVILGYFGLNIREIMASPVVRDNLAWFWEFLRDVWSGWLRTPVFWLWDTILEPLWEILLDVLRGL